MKTLFTDLYNKILEIFQRDKTESTSGCAVDRLQVILMHDRTKLDPLIMNKMREELIDVFSKYVVIDKEKLEIDLTNEGNAAALMLNIPIIRAKTEEELAEIRKQIQAEEEKVDDSDDENEETQSEKNEKEDDNLTEENESDDNKVNNDEETIISEAQKVEEDSSEEDKIIEEEDLKE